MIIARLTTNVSKEIPSKLPEYQTGILLLLYSGDKSKLVRATTIIEIRKTNITVHEIGATLPDSSRFRLITSLSASLLQLITILTSDIMNIKAAAAMITAENMYCADAFGDITFCPDIISVEIARESNTIERSIKQMCTIESQHVILKLNIYF
jgi:hypothetical protein